MGFVARYLKHIEPRPIYQDFGFAHIDPKAIAFHLGVLKDQYLLYIIRVTNNSRGYCCQAMSMDTFMQEGYGRHFIDIFKSIFACRFVLFCYELNWNGLQWLQLNMVKQ